MKTIPFKAEATSAYGKKLANKLEFSGTYEAYENFAEMKAANDLLKDDEQLKARNARRKAAAVTKERETQLEAIGHKKPTLENDPIFRLKSMYDIYIAAGKSEQEAKDLASAALGTDWPEDEDE